MDANARYICDRLTNAAADFTSLGRWGWALAITFLTQMLMSSAKEKGRLFAPYVCGGDAKEIANGFLLVIAIGAAAYGYFLWRSARQVVAARSEVKKLQVALPSSALEFAARNAPTDGDLVMASVMRALIFVVLLGVWCLMFDIGTRVCPDWARP